MHFISYVMKHYWFLLQELGTSLIFQLGRAGSPSEALYVYNMLRHSKRRPCKTLHEKVLHILVAAGLLKEVYVVMKV